MEKQHYSGVYYSIYPYAAEDFEVEHLKEDHRYYSYKQPFRLYKAAVCATQDPVDSLEDFLNLIWEVLDEAEHILDTIHKPFTLDGLMVTPTKHLYGATNTFDGIYQVNGYFYVKTYSSWKIFSDWKEAVDYVFWNYLHDPKCYKKGIDYTMPK